MNVMMLTLLLVTADTPVAYHFEGTVGEIAEERWCSGLTEDFPVTGDPLSAEVYFDGRFVDDVFPGNGLWQVGPMRMVSPGMDLVPSDDWLFIGTGNRRNPEYWAQIDFWPIEDPLYSLDQAVRREVSGNWEFYIAWQDGYPDETKDDCVIEFSVDTITAQVLGDANLDGTFDSTDLVTVFQFGEYEDETVNNSKWATGDFNASGDFDSLDLVSVFQAGTYTTGAAAIVPEPSALVLCVFGAGILPLLWRRRGSQRC